jgi:GNAT superfamily N-acetyltransferase
MPTILIRQATLEDLATVCDILQEAALWLEKRNMKLWGEQEISPKVVRSDIQSNSFYIAFCENYAAGVVKFQTEDLVFWSDIPHQDSAFIHRLAVRRSFAGGLVSTALMKWAINYSRQLGKRYLRLDCDVARHSLRSVYEKFGFRHHSDIRVGSYFIARYEYEI